MKPSRTTFQMAVQIPVPGTTFRLVRVFLASPGDLADERRAAREAVEEVNKTIARPAGFHVDLIGWEDTISDRRRPQEIINEDLDSCEMFVGAMWKKWGTPPDTEGTFTSGFEEEFALAGKLLGERGSPVMRLYFKDVDPSLLNDPGDDLKKVLSFRDKVIEEKKIYFETFKDSGDFARRIRISVADYINKLRSEIRREQESSTESPRQASQADDQEEREQQDDNLPQLIQARFLADVASKITEPNGEVSEVEIARLRNMTNWLAQSPNDELVIGSHDANLLYAARESLTLADPEISNLADAGLAAYSTENLPVWYWVGNRLSAVPEWLVLSTFIGSVDARVGAFRALALMDEDIPEKIIGQTRSQLIISWFNEHAADKAKIEALRYLGTVGRREDLEFIEEELNKKDSATFTAAVEARIALALRHEGARAAANFTLSVSFDEISSSILSPILAALEELDSESLERALNHRSAKIRLSALEILQERACIESHRARELFEDAELKVRVKAMQVVAQLENLRWSREDARPILIRKPVVSVLGSTGGYDWEGEDALEHLQVEMLFKNSKTNLQAIVESGNYGWFLAYQAMAQRHFGRFSTTMRLDFDNRFKRRFEKTIQATRDLASNAPGVEPLIDQMRKTEAFTRRTWMRQVADILVEHAEATDLPRIRKALDDDEMDPAQADMIFFGARGEREDIKRIEKIYGDYRSRGKPTTILGSKPATLVAANALLRLTGKRAHELLTSDLPGELIAAVAYGMSKATFSQLSEERLITVMGFESDAIRKVVALRLIEIYDEKRVQRIARKYSQGNYRYYNVVRWLDLAFGLSRPRAKLVAQRELARYSAKWD